MTRGTIASAAALMLGLAGSANGAVRGKSGHSSEPTQIAKRLDCASHRFEATIRLNGPDGKSQIQTVRMCGIKGESDSEWVETLKDALRKTASSSQMPEDAKKQIIAAVKAEISRLSLPSLNLPGGADISKLPRTSTSRAPEAQGSLADYNALPPLPTAPPVQPPHLLDSNGAIADQAHLTLGCAFVGDEDRASVCDSLDRDTVLIFRADQAYPRGLEVRFMRHGNSRAHVNFPAMSVGETRKLRLPAAVCSGVVRSNIEIEALGADAPAGMIAGKVGEYDLRC